MTRQIPNPINSHVTPNKGSASKRLKIFEDITSPQAGTTTSAAASTAPRGQLSTANRNINSTTNSYLESQESSSEEIEEAIETDEEPPCDNKGGRLSFFESFTKFSSSNENDNAASKNS